MEQDELIIDGSKLVLIKGDITSVDTDAIVNAANTRLIGGGGVDGAIRRKAGPELEEECARIRKEKGGCHTGEAVITTGGNLKAKYVIHTPGPVWRGGNKNESEYLRNSYRNSLELASEYKIRSISFPSISTGVYRYPLEEASQIAVDEIVRFLKLGRDPKFIQLVLFDNKTYNAYKAVLIGYK